MVENPKMSEVMELGHAFVASSLSLLSLEEEKAESHCIFPMENHAIQSSEFVSVRSSSEISHCNARHESNSANGRTSKDKEEDDDGSGDDEEYGEVEEDTEEEEEEEEEEDDDDDEEEEDVENSTRVDRLSPLGGISRSRSVTDEDMAELRGCIDLGFGFCQTESVDLKTTLPALELYYAITRQYQDMKTRPSSLSSSATDPTSILERTSSSESCSSSNSDTWRISSPGESTNRVKTRLRHWAQAVACSVKECL